MTNKLENGIWFPYIKPTRRIHDSGYRIFEVGYIFEDEKTKVVLGECTDHIQINTLTSDFPNPNQVNIDLLKNGLIQFYETGDGLCWRHNQARSTMWLSKGFPNYELFKPNKMNNKNILCKLGIHKWRYEDENITKTQKKEQGNSWFECKRCGKIKDKLCHYRSITNKHE